jgi:hypothetical protein
MCLQRCSQNLQEGRIIAQVVQCWLLNMETWSQDGVTPYEGLVEVVALYQVFLLSYGLISPASYSAVLHTSVILTSSVLSCSWSFGLGRHL